MRSSGRQLGAYGEYFGTDHAWPILDSKGFVGVFITGGWGPIPRVVERHPLMLEVERRAAVLPVGACRWVHPSAMQSRSMIDLARRGFFVYDWDPPSVVGPYTKVAAPALALHVRDLPREVAECLPPASANVVLDIAFAARSEIDVRAKIECLYPT